jgi:alkylmercury lyase
MADRYNIIRYAEPDMVKGQISFLLPPMDPVEQKLTLSLYRLLGTGKAPTQKDLALDRGFTEECVGTFLETWSTVTDIDATGRIVGFRGLTLRPTEHLLEISGQTLFTWCAWDLLFLPMILQRPDGTAFGKTRCPVTNTQILVTIGPTTVESLYPKTAFLTFPVPSSNQHIRESFCCHTYFLASENAANEWLKDHPFASFLSISEAYDIGIEMNKTLFANGMG